MSLPYVPMALPYVPYRKSSHIIELGYIERSPHWRLDSRFFPSKVGGKPAWLDLTTLPSDLTCKKCKKPCVFLLQLYAPLQSKDSCFHRSFFVFVCKDPLCCEKNSNKNFRVYRSQIPRSNPYYEYTPPVENPSWNEKFSVSNWCKICEVCGASAGHVCGKCRAVYYCCRLHQQIAWKSGHKRVCGKGRENSPDNTGFLLPEYEIYCEPEDQDDRYEASAVVEGRRTRKENNVAPSVSMNGSKPAAKKSDKKTVAIANNTEIVTITNGTKTVVNKTGTETVSNEIDVKTIGNEKDARTILNENGMVPAVKTNGVETLLNDSETEPTVNANGLKPVVNGSGNELVVNENGIDLLENKVGTRPLENGSGMVTEPVLNKNDTAVLMKNAIQPEAEISNLQYPLQSDKTGSALELKDQKTCEEETDLMSKTDAVDNTEEKSEDDKAEMQGAKKKTRKRNRRGRGRKKKTEDHVDDAPDELDENERIQMNELQKVINENPGILQENLNAEELERYAKVETDQHFRRFQERVRRHPTQILRYCINSEEGPLWVSGENILLVKDVPRCQKCNAVRVYEFQILPQLLNFLGLDSKEASIDWGTLVIYSCSASCDGAPSYKEEFLYKQDFSEK